jgi:hypothetical protein
MDWADWIIVASGILALCLISFRVGYQKGVDTMGASIEAALGTIKHLEEKGDFARRNMSVSESAISLVKELRIDVRYR